MAQAPPNASVINAYWKPGCTSCLGMKEFVIKHGVAFISINVLEDKDAFAERAALGIRSVPVVRRGQDWANGQILRVVARVAGVACRDESLTHPHGASPLSGLHHQTYVTSSGSGLKDDIEWRLGRPTHG
jgi:hypothetical protein